MAIHFPSSALVAANFHYISQSLLNLTDTANGPSLFASPRQDLRFAGSSIRSDGNRRGRPIRQDKRRGNSDEAEIPESVDGTFPSTSKKQDEIIALFRRIQTSISNGEAVATKKRSSKLSQDKSSTTAESVLEVLRQSSKKAKDKTSKEEENKTSIRRGVHKKEQKMLAEERVLDVKPTRPPSKFVRRSPISQPVSAKVNDFELNSETPLTIVSGKEEVVKVDEMKLAELKELAKSRGLKGYSKLKKSELLALLRS